MLFDILGTVADVRGIKVDERFLKPSREDILSPYLIKNMDKGISMFTRHTENGGDCAVLVDSDPDGYTSASIIGDYIENNHKSINVRYIIHSGRQHGLTPEVMKDVKEKMPNILIIPDASSGDFEQHKELKELGLDILVLDHHNVSHESEDAVVVSNHSNITKTETNRELSGAGITLKFIEALDQKYGTDESVKYYAHAAVGIVADMMPILHPETRYYVYEGLKNVQNPLIRQFIYKNSYHTLKQSHPKTVSFSISNFMNALIRMGSQEDKMLMFEALLGREQSLTRISKYRGVEREVTENIHETVYRLCSNARARQNTQKRKLIQQAIDYVEDNNLKNNALITVLLGSLPEGFSGFLAADISKIYKRPVLVMTWSEDSQAYTGSGRGLDNIMLDTRKFVEDLGVFNFSSGHKQAFGVSINKENIEGLNKIINDKITIENRPLEVDFEVDVKAVTDSLAKEFDSYEYLWCKGFDEPLMAIKNVEVDCSDIVFGNTTKFNVKGIEYFAFQSDQQLEEFATEGKVVTLDVIGTLGINRFLGKEKPQVKIEMIDIKEIKDKPVGLTFEF